jgi:hypothetical protein
MRAIARLGLRGLLLGLDLLAQLRELDRNIFKQIKFQFENRNLNTQVLLKFWKMNFAGSTIYKNDQRFKCGFWSISDTSPLKDVGTLL